MSYNSKHTGKEIDDAVDKVKELGTAEIATEESVAMAITNALASKEREVIVVAGAVINSLEPNKIYISETTEGVTELAINAIASSDKPYNEYTLLNIPTAVSNAAILTLLLPDIGIKWPNGEIPELMNSDCFELSIISAQTDNSATYNAVLTKFIGL